MGVILDLLTATFVAVGVAWGRRSGLPKESYRLLRLITALVVGCGFYGLIARGLERLLSRLGDLSAPLAFIITVGGAWWILRAVRRRYMAWVGARFDRYARPGGAIAGGLRALLLAVTILAALGLAGSVPGRDSARHGSLVGRLAGWIVRAK
jgi:hypothetical protein